MVLEVVSKTGYHQINLQIKSEFARGSVSCSISSYIKNIQQQRIFNAGKETNGSAQVQLLFNQRMVQKGFSISAMFPLE